VTAVVLPLSKLGFVNLNDYSLLPIIVSSSDNVVATRERKYEKNAVTVFGEQPLWLIAWVWLFLLSHR
jgi:hypothetical protein